MRASKRKVTYRCFGNTIIIKRYIFVEFNVYSTLSAVEHGLEQYYSKLGCFLLATNTHVHHNISLGRLHMYHDVLVTKEGHEVLSKDVPKEPDEIEALMASYMY